MSIKYAVYKPTTGENILYETKEEAIESFWLDVIKMAREACHNTAYMVVEQNEDGSETWYNDNNMEIEKPVSQEEIERWLSITQQNKTPVEVLP
jgi:hypothetical protein